MKQRGQSLVEMALVLPILLLLLVGSADLFGALADVAIAKHMTSVAARGAALSTLPDGITSCQARVDSLMSGDYFFLADWSYTVTNCPSNPFEGIVQGSQTSVQIVLNYHPAFLPGDPWTFNVEAVDYGR